LVWEFGKKKEKKQRRRSGEEEEEEEIGTWSKMDEAKKIWLGQIEGRERKRGEWVQVSNHR
jgi:hypothetical protein